MAGPSEGITPAQLAAAYEAMVALGDTGDLGAAAREMRAEFQRRTGAYGPEDPWFENRARAFWDDALTTQGFAAQAAKELGEREESFTAAPAAAIAAAFARSHRGFFLVEEVDARQAHLADVWSGAELLVRVIDETQALALEHAEGPMDARVSALPGSHELVVLPGAYHHPADALEPAIDVLIEARARGLETQAALDALMRMELILRSSSRVKAPFAYRVENL
jgi:hypothetical protein